VKFRIDAELRSLIPPLSKEEYKQLEDNIRQWGCLDPLKVWPVKDSDEVILLDGHNRFAICSEHNVSYVTESISLIDRAAAIDWMIANQLGRRNLSAKQVSYLRGRQQHQEKQRVANPDGIGGKSGKIVKSQNATQQSLATADRLARQHGVNRATIHRDADYAEAVDAIVAATAPEVQQQLLGIDSKLTKSATLKLAELVQEEPGVLMEIIEEAQQTSNKTAASAVVQRFISENREAPMSKEMARLIDFETVGEGLNWLLGRFTVAEMSEWLTQNLINEEAEAETEFDEFNDDEKEED
jgi:hypothetical protein